MTYNGWTNYETWAVGLFLGGNYDARFLGVVLQCLGECVAELERDAELTLTTGEVIYANDLVIGDEIESHYSTETGGRGHRVVR